MNPNSKMTGSLIEVYYLYQLFTQLYIHLLDVNTLLMCDFDDF